MRVPYTFDVNAKFKNEEYGNSRVPIRRLPAIKVPTKGERFVIDEELAKRMFGENYKEIASFYPVDLGRVDEIRHYIDLEDKLSRTKVFTSEIPSQTETQDKFNEFVKKWNAEHLPHDSSLPHEMYLKHSLTYRYDLQIHVVRDNEYTRTMRNVPFEVEVVHGHTFNLHDDRGHTQFDIPIIVSEVKSVVPARKKSNPVIHVDLVGISRDVARIRPKLQERQYERLDLFEKDWNASYKKSRKDASVV